MQKPNSHQLHHSWLGFYGWGDRNSTRPGVTLEQLEQIGHSLPLGRFQSPEDTAQAVLYLASDESAQMTGAILHLDAGASTLPAPWGEGVLGVYESDCSIIVGPNRSR